MAPKSWRRHEREDGAGDADACLSATSGGSFGWIAPSVASASASTAGNAPLPLATPPRSASPPPKQARGRPYLRHGSPLPATTRKPWKPARVSRTWVSASLSGTSMKLPGIERRRLRLAQIAVDDQPEHAAVLRLERLHPTAQSEKVLQADRVERRHRSQDVMATVQQGPAVTNVGHPALELVAAIEAMDRRAIVVGDRAELGLRARAGRDRDCPGSASGKEMAA